MMLLYVPISPQEAALNLAKLAIDRQLAGCVNILPGVISVYNWQGLEGETQLTTSEECILIFKTPHEKAESLKALILQAHPYECPAILSWTVNTNPEFEGWISAQCAIKKD